MQELWRIYKDVYKDNTYVKVEEAFKQLENLMASYKKLRTKDQKKRDQVNKCWFLSEEMVGMSLYVDLFCEDLSHFEEKLPYLMDLGINMIHFMPVLKGRPGENDGGYAVMDYKSIDSKLGDFKTFEKLLETLSNRGIHTCIDFVVNHTAKEHEWAKKALAGDSHYMDYYLMYEDQKIPDILEATVPEVFPKVSPGNFTYYEEIERYVWTSFYEFQWDLNYKNPRVFEGIVDILLYLANKGVDMIRLDAIPFIWKELGTTCRNLKEVHPILRMLHLIVEEVCPSVALLGEAIVEAQEIVGYYGEETVECDLMYNAPLMVNMWNSLATKDTRLMTTDMNRLIAPKKTAWINYIRCHDDIGWGFNELAISDLGFDPFLHKQFLIDFYVGAYEPGFAIGELYEFDAKTLDARNSGTMASLSGLEMALHNKDGYQHELALKRIEMINGLLMSSSGLPIIYSGDEVGTLNDYTYKKIANKSHDSRWLHRSSFNWLTADDLTMKDHDPSTIYQALKRLISMRKNHPIFSAKIAQVAMYVENIHVFAFTKVMQGQVFIGLFNFSEDRQFVSTSDFGNRFSNVKFTDMLQGKRIDISLGQILLGPYEYLWLLSDERTIICT